MNRRDLLKSFCLVPVVQLAPWLEEVRPAHTILGIIYDEFLVGRDVHAIYVSSTFFRQFEFEAYDGNLEYDGLKVSNLPSKTDTITMLVRDRDRKNYRSYTYDLHMFKEVKGLNLVLNDRSRQ
jgi:hypothetical protein